MKRAILSAALAIAFMAGVSAEDKPNFAGKWTRDAEKTTAANPNAGGGGGGGGGRGGGGGGGGATFEIKQDATTLTRTAIGQDGTPGAAAVYKLDGTDSKNMQPGRGGGAPTEVVSKATWVGNTISISTTRDMGGTPVTSTVIYSMEGDWLVTATTQPGRDGGAPTTNKVYFKKG